MPNPAPRPAKILAGPHRRAQDALAVHFGGSPLSPVGFHSPAQRRRPSAICGRCSIGEDMASIKAGLLDILADIEANKFHPDITQEDIHMAVEAALIQRIGEPGRRLHTARSRNDQVAVDIRLWCREAIGILNEKVTDLQRALRHNG